MWAAKPKGFQAVESVRKIEERITGSQIRTEKLLVRHVLREATEHLKLGKSRRIDDNEVEFAGGKISLHAAHQESVEHVKLEFRRGLLRPDRELHTLKGVIQIRMKDLLHRCAQVIESERRNTTNAGPQLKTMAASSGEANAVVAIECRQREGSARGIASGQAESNAQTNVERDEVKVGQTRVRSGRHAKSTGARRTAVGGRFDFCPLS